MNGSPGSISGMGAEQMGVKMEPAEAECLSMSGSSNVGTTPASHNGVKPVSPEQEELIHRLVYYQSEYEQPNEDDIKRITVSTFFFFKCENIFGGLLNEKCRKKSLRRFWSGGWTIFSGHSQDLIFLNPSSTDHFIKVIVGHFLEFLEFVNFFNLTIVWICDFFLIVNFLNRNFLNS